MDSERLAVEIKFDVERLRKLAAAVESFLCLIEDDPLPWHAAAGAKYVSDIWMGFENLCKRRYAYLQLPFPSGGDSHSRLLEDFLEQPDLGAQLPGEIQYRLKKYKSFRHRFIHGYGFEVLWEKVDEPLRLLPQTVEILCGLWLEWLNKTISPEGADNKTTQ